MDGIPLLFIVVLITKCALATNELVHSVVSANACAVDPRINTDLCAYRHVSYNFTGVQEDALYLPEDTVCEVKDELNSLFIECTQGKWLPVTRARSDANHRVERSWFSKLIKKVVCWFKTCKSGSQAIPNSPPSISCPSIPTVFTAMSEVSALVSWGEPTVSDPNGDAYSVFQTQGNKAGTLHQEGTYTVSYMAKDSKDASNVCSSTFRVEVRRCSIENTYIMHGKAACQPTEHNNIFGSLCEYSCDDGYELVGSQNSQCNADGQWSTPKPDCRAIACQAPTLVSHGQFTCGPGGYNFMSTCFLNCAAGYDVDKKDTIKCLASKVWTSPGVCIDSEAPNLNCGENIEAFAGPKLAKVSVQWPPVTAVDNSGLSYPVISDIQSGDFFDVGQTPVKFSATDDQKNVGRCTKIVTVNVKRCPYYESIENADVSCSHGNAYGSVCTSVCNQGYQLVGGDSQTCQLNQTWSGSKPSCTPRECGNPPFVAHGNYSCPSGLKYKDICTLTCDAGFQPVTPTTIECNSRVEWSQGGSCLDIQPPTFPNNCSLDLEVIASGVGQPTYVNLTLPVAVDNSGEGVLVKSNPVSGSIFPLGPTKVTVTATDTQGLQATCSFFVVVKSISCEVPNIDTSGKNLIAYDCPDLYVYGASCLLTCNSGNPLTGSNKIRCEYADGTSNLQWKIEGNANPFCNPQSCSKLRPPNNGALACDLLGGASEICLFMCNEKYTYPYQSPYQFSCLKRTGTWLPEGTTRDCVTKQKVKAVTTELQFYYYTGSCSNDSIDIKQKFVQAVSLTVFSELCTEDFPCMTDTVAVSCGIIARRRKRDTSSSSNEYTISVIINIGEYRDMGSPESTFQYYDKIVMGINDKIQAKADAGLLNVPSIGTFDTFDYGQVGLKCDPGMKMVQRTMACAGCGAGYMFNNETESCLSCPVGTYQDKDVAFSCVSCPVGKTTKGKSSNSLSQCLDLCTPGSVSQNGTKPCKPCPVGTYQSDIGMKQCNKCPYGTSTTLPGQTAPAACQFYDVKMTENSTGPVIQIFDAVPKRFTFMTWIFDTTVASVNVVNNSTAKLLLDQFVINLAPVTADFNRNLRKWNHLAIAYSNGNVTLYLNGQQIYFSSGLNFTALDKKSLYFRKSKDVSKVVINGIQMTTTLYSALQIKEFSLSCTKQVDKQVLAPNPFSPTLISTSTCIDKDLCSGKPCGQHGVCVIGSQNLTCLCDSPWSGDRCQNVTDFCADNLCANGSTCVNRPEDKNYTCSCAPGFFGLLCHEKLASQKIASWGAWSSWSKCSVACGSGERTRTRQCNNLGQVGCQGVGIVTEVCQSACQDCHWSEWVTSPCSGTCGDQQAIRTRTVLNDATGGGMPCQGLNLTLVSCNLTECSVNGKFGDWSEWSQCSKSCGGGSSIRRRLCDNPPPSKGGAQCDNSLAVEKITCNVKPCPECKLPELREGHKSLNCSNFTGDEMQICSIICEPGLTVVEFDNTFMCGPATNYTWTHQTIDNPTGLLPACTDKNVPLQLEPEIIVTFDIDCNNKSNVEEMQKLISEQLRLNGCTKENNCFFDINSVSNCVVSKRRSLGTLTLTINLSLTTKSETETLDDDSTPDVEQEKEKLKNFENLLNQLVNQTDDGLIFFLGGSFPSGNIESLQTSVLCQEGAGYYNGFCVDCQAGSYSNGNGSCVLCDKGFFQDRPRMTYCTQCPVGSTTSNKGSFSSDHCTMEPVKFEDVYPCYVPNNDQSKHNDITINIDEDHIALISGLTAASVVVVVILIAIIVLCFRKRQNKSVETVTVFNKDQPKKM